MVMNNWKKTLCMLIAVTVIASSMAGCGSSTTSTSTESAVVSEQTVESGSDIEESEAETETEVTEASAEESAVEETAEETGGNTFAYTDESEEAPADTTVSGKVTAVDGNAVTLEIGGGMSGDMGGGDMGSGETPPDKPEDSGNGGGTAPNGQQGGDPGAQAAGDSGAAQPTDNGTGTSESGESTVPAKPEDAGTVTDADAEGTQDPTENADGAGDGSAPEMPTDNGGEAAEAEEATLVIGDESVITVSGEQGSLEDITEGTMLEITFDADGMITEIAVSEETGMGGDMGGMNGGMGGGMSSSADIDYTAVNEYTEDATVSDEEIESTGADENAVLVSGDAEVTLDSVTIDRTSEDSTGGDNSSFYGVGAAVLATDGTTYVKDSGITTDAKGGAGIFAYGDGTVYAANDTISTTEDTSGGIHAAGGGALYAWQLVVNTEGQSSAAIRSDRGGGTMVIDGGTYTANGVGSPSVYCTADIAVNDAELTANGSEAICMEGLNTIHLFDCDITGNMADLDQNDTTWNIIVYQSMSGDSEVGNSTMQIVGGSLTAENGGMIYTTNTECDILLSDVDITYAEDSEFFLQCTGNTNQRGWGTSGANGSDCTFTADQQEMEGKVIWDSISNLDFYMTNGSTLRGSFVDDETWAGQGGDGECNVYISEDSTWIADGDSTVTNLYNAGTIEDADGNTVSIVGTDGTVYVNGTSSYTITVESYSTDVDLSGAAEVDSWANHEVDMPSELQ